MTRPTRVQLSSQTKPSKGRRGRQIHPRKRACCSLFMVLMLGCSIVIPGFAQVRQRPARPDPAASPKTPVPSLPPVPSFSPEELQGMQAVLETSQGQVVLEFYADLAPSHVKYFAGLVKTGAYDGTTFHRVILRGIIQGGDPLS